MWIMRAGQKALFLDKFLSANKIYLPWDGYCTSLENVETREDFRELVIKETGSTQRTSISNWAGQLYSFAKEMKVDDYLLIPQAFSRGYILAKIKGDYCFDEQDADSLYHSREIEVVQKDIPRDTFSQSIQYSLGAFRTLFKVKAEDEVLQTIMKWKETVK